MLKIAEYNTITGKKVELSELEKYGFKLEKGYNYDFYQKKSNENIELTYYVDIDFKNISVTTYDGDEVELDNTIYDLIKDGYVVKE